MNYIKLCKTYFPSSITFYLYVIMPLALTSTEKEMLHRNPKGLSQKGACSPSCYKWTQHRAIGQDSAQKKLEKQKEKYSGSRKDNLPFFPSPAFWNFMFMQVILPKMCALDIDHNILGNL